MQNSYKKLLIILTVNHKILILIKIHFNNSQDYFKLTFIHIHKIKERKAY